MASIIKADTLQSTTSNIFFLNSVGTEYARFDSSGVFQLANSITTSFPAGTAALPSISTIGDTNTGIFFPAADTIAFAEGGVESMRIDSSGNVKLSAANTKILNSSGNPILQQTGSVLQVVQTVKTSYFTSASASFVDVTGLSVTITPSSTTSKILVLFSGYASQSSTAGTYGLHLRLVRDSTNIFLGDAAGSAQQSSAQIGSSHGHYAHNLSGQFLDSPSTTSAITYKIQMYVESGGTGGLGGSYIVTNAWQGRTPSQITVMEIAG